MKTKKISTRKCVACQEMKPKKELLRVVRTPEKEIMIDLTGKKSGRGAYICYNDECIALAKKKKSLERALEQAIEDITYQQIKVEINKFYGNE